MEKTEFVRLTPDPYPQPVHIKDLAMLVSRLARQLKIAAPDHDLPQLATAYLTKHDLIGSPLRAEEESAPGLPQQLPEAKVTLYWRNQAIENGQQLAATITALATAERMLADRDEPTTVFPERTVIMEFTHQHIGDRLFTPEVEEAMRQLLKSPRRTDQDEFSATNSVQVSIHALEMLDPPEDGQRNEDVRFIDHFGARQTSGRAKVESQPHGAPMDGVNIDAAHGEQQP